VTSNSVPFPIAVGNTWVYKTNVGLNRTVSTVTDKIYAVTSVPGGQRVSMGSSINRAGNREIYIFHSDGSITYPFSQLGSQAKIVKGSIQWPPASVINSGQPTTSTLEISSTYSGQTITETGHITVKGEGTATVTVPAGTYTATIVDMVETFTVLGHTGKIEVKTWVANTVGPVKSEVISEEVGGTSFISSNQELVSFTKG
jgi:hypothetical protein